MGVAYEVTCFWIDKDGLTDFNGGHAYADPNLTYAKELVGRKGSKIDVDGPIPSFGASAVFCHAF